MQREFQGLEDNVTCVLLGCSPCWTLAHYRNMCRPVEDLRFREIVRGKVFFVVQTGLRATQRDGLPGLVLPDSYSFIYSNNRSNDNAAGVDDKPVDH